MADLVATSINKFLVVEVEGFCFVFFLQSQTFHGNSDASSVKNNYFRDTFVTRYLRIYPKTYYNDMCLRVELYGCNDRSGLSSLTILIYLVFIYLYISFHVCSE